MTRWTVASVLAAGALAAAAARGEENSRPFSLANDLTLGAHGYLVNATVASIAPTTAWGVDIAAGVTNTATPVFDSTRSVGVTGRVDVLPAVTLALAESLYTGAHSTVYAVVPQTGLSRNLAPQLDVVGEADDRQAFSTLGGTVAVRVVDPGEDEPGWRPLVRVSLGTSNEQQTIPLWQEQSLSKEWKRIASYQNVDQAYAGGVTVAVRKTTLGFTLTRHHYTSSLVYSGSPTGQEALVLTAVLKDLHASSGSPIQGLPIHDAEMTLGQPLPLDLNLSLAYVYSRLQPATDAPDAENLARTFACDLAWSPAAWLEARAGASWVVQNSGRTSYARAGVSVYY